MNTVHDLTTRGIGFKVLTGLGASIDTTSPSGKLVFGLFFAALAEFERALIRERTNAGLTAARQRGRVGGRPRSLTEDKREAAKELLASGTPPRDVARIVGVSIATLYRHLPASRSAA